MVTRVLLVLALLVTGLVKASSHEEVPAWLIDLVLGFIFGENFIIQLGLAERITWGTLIFLALNLCMLSVIVDANLKTIAAMIVTFALLVIGAIVNTIEGRLQKRRLRQAS